MAALLMGASRGILNGPRRSLGERPRPNLSTERKGGQVTEAYCVKDKMKVEMKNPAKVTMKNGKPAWKGTCPKCGTSVFRIGA